MSVPTHSVVSDVPLNLPVLEGEETESEMDVLKALETHAHVHATLISSDALKLIASQHGTRAEQMETLDTVIALAKSRYPSENEWMVLNKERVMALLA